jgi:hypothetical protein
VHLRLLKLGGASTSAVEMRLFIQMVFTMPPVEDASIFG